MMRLAVAAVLVALLSACADLLPRETRQAPLVKPPASADEAVFVARDLVRRGRWSSAIGLLKRSASQYPDSTEITGELKRLVARWAYERQLIEDRMMISDAENQKVKIELLRQMSKAEPDNLILISRRIYWKEALEGKVEPLTRCGETYVEAEAKLAKRCFDLVSGMAVPELIEQRLAKVGSQLREGEQAAAQRRRAHARKVEQTRAKVLLGEARVAIDARQYRRALDVLEKVEKLQPENREVSGLQEEAWSMISPQIEALIKLGDHLYLDEQLEAAAATWGAALNLKPGDPDIVARIERARTVMDRLSDLRQRQQLPVAETSPREESTRAAGE